MSKFTKEWISVSGVRSVPTTYNISNKEMLVGEFKQKLIELLKGKK